MLGTDLLKIRSDHNLQNSLFLGFPFLKQFHHFEFFISFLKTVMLVMLALLKQRKEGYSGEKKKKRLLFFKVRKDPRIRIVES